MNKICSMVLLLLVLTACADVVPTPQTGVGGAPSEPKRDAMSMTPTEEAPAPTSTPVPTAVQPAAQPSPAETTSPESRPPAAQQTIVIEQPQEGETVANPVPVRGRVSLTPFEANLVGQVLDASGNLIGQGPIQAPGEYGQPTTFSGEIPIDPSYNGPATVEVADISAKDGSVIASAQVNVTVGQAPSGSARLELPQEDARVTVPVHVLARFSDNPGEMLTVALRWQNGVELTQQMPVWQEDNGQYLLIGSLDWMMESEPPQPADPQATLEIRDAGGVALIQRNLHVLRWDDSETQEIKLYWILGEQLQEMTQRIPKTARIGTAALEELLWGPRPSDLAGFQTAIPTPREVLSYPGREPDWGPRVRLLELTIEEGVAMANFSQELRAYGGGATRASLIRQQITQTLMQFPTVREVRIAIEGQTEGVLEP